MNTKILFVCTGNVFRSVGGKYFFEKHARDCGLNHLEISSAGTVAGELKIPEFVWKKFLYAGIDVSEHMPKRLEDYHLKESDLVVAMGLNHQESIKRRGFESYLFNEICFGEKTGVLDVGEGGGEWTQKRAEYHVRETIDYIKMSMPKFAENYTRFLSKESAKV